MVPKPAGESLKVLCVAGARPNFMKVAPILSSLRDTGHAGLLVHTGQHYGPMSESFFRDLDLPRPDYDLGVGSASHAVQTARIMEAFEPVLLDERPDWVVVVGDVNSTLGAALVAAKLAPEIGCRLAHVEAGLRSRDRGMPEEINRIVTDQVADLLLTPSPDARANLEAEGIPGKRIAFVGNVMIDTLLSRIESARAESMPSRVGVIPGRYAVATLHRPSNVDDPGTLRVILGALAGVAARMPVVLPLHPRTRRNAESLGLREYLDALQVLDPLGYLEMLSLTDGAAVVLTDSGGLQEETTALGIPCVTLREQTERPITLTEGTNRLAPWPPTAEGISEAFESAVASGRAPAGHRRPEGWDGRAAGRIVDALTRYPLASAD